MQPQDTERLMAAMSKAAGEEAAPPAPTAPANGEMPQMVLKIGDQEITDPMEIINYVNQVQTSMNEKKEDKPGEQTPPEGEEDPGAPVKNKPLGKEQIEYIMQG